MLAECPTQCRDDAACPESQCAQNLPPGDPLPADGSPPASDAERVLDDDFEPPTTEEIENFRPRRVPSARNRDIYREVKILGRSERNVAKEYGLTQPRIWAICQQVKEWMQEGGSDLDGLSEEARVNLCTENARLRLSLTFSQAAKWLEATGQPPPSDAGKKGPNPKPAFVGYMLRAAIELAKIEGVYPNPKSPVQTPKPQECGMQCADCRVDASAGNPQSAIGNPKSSPTPRSPEPPLRRRPHVPPNELLSHRGAAIAFGHIDTSNVEEANRMREHGSSEEEIAEIARRMQLYEPGNCYRAVAEAHAPTPDQTDDLEFEIIHVQIAAEKADAVAVSWLQKAENWPPPVEGKYADLKKQGTLQAYRSQNLETLLATDCHLTDDAYWAVMARYRYDTGRFDWQRDTGRKDLASLLIHPWDEKKPRPK